MQSAERFPYTPATKLLSRLAMALCAGVAQRVLVRRAQLWYHAQLFEFENESIHEIHAYPFAPYGIAFRTQIAVGLIHLAATNPLIALAGVGSVVLLPVMILLHSLWRLAVHFVL